MAYSTCCHVVIFAICAGVAHSSGAGSAGFPKYKDDGYLDDISRATLSPLVAAKQGDRALSILRGNLQPHAVEFNKLYFKKPGGYRQAKLDFQTIGATDKELAYDDAGEHVEARAGDARVVAYLSKGNPNSPAIVLTRGWNTPGEVIYVFRY